MGKCVDRAGFHLTFQNDSWVFLVKITTKLILNVAHHCYATMTMFHSRSLKTAFKYISYIFTLWNNLFASCWNNIFVSCARILLWKKDSMKELSKNHLNIFLIKLCEIVHWRRKDYFCFYKYFTNQTFTFINSKVV